MSDIDPDALVVDFTDVEGAAGFTALPRGRYLLQVVDWELTEVKNQGGKLAAGTPGVKFEFDVVEHPEYEDRKLWNTFWIAATSLPYLKGFMAASGEYGEDELDGPLGDVREHAQRLVDADARWTADVVIQKDNPQYNNIRNFLPASEYSGAQAEKSTSLMP